MESGKNKDSDAYLNKCSCGGVVRFGAPYDEDTFNSFLWIECPRCGKESAKEVITLEEKKYNKDIVRIKSEHMADSWNNGSLKTSKKEGRIASKYRKPEGAPVYMTDCGELIESKSPAGGTLQWKINGDTLLAFFSPKADEGASDTIDLSSDYDPPTVIEAISRLLDRHLEGIGEAGRDICWQFDYCKRRLLFYRAGDIRDDPTYALGLICDANITIGSILRLIKIFTDAFPDCRIRKAA